MDSSNFNLQSCCDLIDRKPTTEIVPAMSNPLQLLVVILCFALFGCSKQKESLARELDAAEAIVSDTSMAFQDVAALETSTRHIGERYSATKGKLAAEVRSLVESALEKLKSFDASCSIAEKQKQLAALRRR